MFRTKHIDPILNETKSAIITMEKTMKGATV
jgi:hypothetical protein